MRPFGFHTELVSDLRTEESSLDEWLRLGADRFGGDAELADALLKLAANADSRKCLVLLGAIVDTPTLVDRLFAALKPVTT